MLRTAGLLLALVSAALGAQQPQVSLPGSGTHKEDLRSADKPASAIGDAERSALAFIRYDLDVHLRPANSDISVLAQVTIRNDGDAKLEEVALQISSELHWDGISEARSGRVDKLRFDQHLLQTDADRTGRASEAVIHLPNALAPHEALELSLFYSGELRSSPAALDGVGVSGSRAEPGDWDSISSAGTYLRGFGHVLWYPVASPQVFVGEGANLLQTQGRQMFRQTAAKAALRISVEYVGDAPAAVFFCGRGQPLVASRDNPDAPVAESPGVATAEFAAEGLGFRTPSLLVVTGGPVSIPGTPLQLVATEDGVARQVSSSASPITAMLNEWFGPEVKQSVTLIDHAGEPLDDGGLFVAPLSAMDAGMLSSELISPLLRARFGSPQLWLDQGMSQFFSLLWMERTEGRTAATAALTEQSHAIALAESMGTSGGKSTSGLLLTSDVVYYRNKSAAVLWMLREIVGDAVLKQTLQRYMREQGMVRADTGFQKLLEEVSGKSLGWFFDDWVYQDRGLPELSIVSVAPRQLASGKTGDAGWLVAVEVRNDGGAVAEVPVTVRSGTLTATERVRVNAHSASSVRVLFQSEPLQVQVNDGMVPEMISNTHVLDIRKGQQLSQ